MPNLILMVLGSLLRSLRTHAETQAEILALRHQLVVLQRTHNKRLVLYRADRWLWAWLSQLWDGWRSALVIVKPETVLNSHRQGFRWYWTWARRSKRPLRRERKRDSPQT